MSVVFINGPVRRATSTRPCAACCVPVAQEELVEVEVAPEAEAQVDAEPEPEPEAEPEPEPEPEPQEVVQEEEGRWIWSTEASHCRAYPAWQDKLSGRPHSGFLPSAQIIFFTPQLSPSVICGWENEQIDKQPCHFPGGGSSCQ